jgi:hypothetical protein
VKLVVHEAAKNAIAHSDPCEHVEVEAEVAQDEVVVQVADTNAEPWELHPENDDELRGLTLIRRLTRRMEVVALRRGTALGAAVERDGATGGVGGKQGRHQRIVGSHDLAAEIRRAQAARKRAALAVARAEAARRRARETRLRAGPTTGETSGVHDFSSSQLEDGPHDPDAA